MKQIKEINWMIVLFNSIVLKETENTYTMYNIWILNWDYWCYLESYIVKEKFDLDKIIQIIQNEIDSWSDLWIKFLNNHLKQEKELDVYDRIPDSQVKKMIEIIKMNLWVEDNIWLDIDMLEEIPEQINNFSIEDLSKYKDKIDFSKINLKDPNIDSYIKQAVSEMISMWDIKKELKESKTIEQKKSLKDKIKSSMKISWKVWIIWALFASTLAWTFSIWDANASTKNYDENLNSKTISQEQYSINDFQIIKWWKILDLSDIVWIKYNDIKIWDIQDFKVDITWVTIDNTVYLRVNEWENILFKWNSIFDWNNWVVYIKYKSWNTIKVVLSNSSWKVNWNSQVDSLWWATTLSKWDVNELPSAWDFWVWWLALLLLWLSWVWLANTLKSLK